MTAEPDVDKIRHRLAIVEALLQAVDRRAELVETVFDAADVSSARQTLMQPPWSFSEVVAIHVLDMSMRRMTTLGRTDLAAEAAELRRLLGDR